MTQSIRSTNCLVRPTVILSVLLILQCYHRVCQSFQQSPLWKTETRSYMISQLIASTSSRSSAANNNRRYTSHTHFYADPSSSNIHDQTPPPPSFEQRMREQLKQHQTNQQGHGAEPSHSSMKHQLVADVRNLKDYKEVLDQTGRDNRMLAVLWYSPWCKACRATIPGIRTLAKRHPGVKFIQVPVLAENASLHQGLDVPSVPYLHLYVPEDPRLVEEKKMTRKRLSGFQKLLCDYEQGYCSLEHQQDGDSGEPVWSTSNPYSVPGRSIVIQAETRINNFPESNMEGVGAAAP